MPLQENELVTERNHGTWRVRDVCSVTTRRQLLTSMPVAEDTTSVLSVLPVWNILFPMLRRKKGEGAIKINKYSIYVLGDISWNVFVACFINGQWLIATETFRKKKT